jgi:hypothetical protein
MNRLHVKNWASFQHYKDRSPSWIKLHKALLDDFTFQRLPVASRALAPMLWLLASESADGSIDHDVPMLAFRLRQTEQEIEGALKSLIQAGFFQLEQSASAPLAAGKQDACLETEVETEKETEKEKKKPRSRSAWSYTPEFEKAWALYPKHQGASKVDAFKAWEARIKSGATPEAMTEGVVRYAAYCKAQETEAKFIKLPETFFGPSRHYESDWTPPPKVRPAGRNERRLETAGLLTTPEQEQGDFIDMEEVDHARIG